MRVAMVGLGWWGQRIIDSVTGSERLSVIAAADPDPSVRAAVAGRVPTVVETFDEVLDVAGVEGVILCSPHRLHPAQIEQAAGRGLHVFSEKPFSATASDAERALEAVARAQVQIGIGHERRFEPAVVRLRELVSSGGLGDALLFEGTFSHDKFRALAPGNWRLSPEQAPVGPLSATGIHLMDLAISLLGSPTDAFARMRSEEFANGDSLAVSLGFPGGASALISAVLVTPFIASLRLYGSRGWVEIRDRAHPENPAGWDVTFSLEGREPVAEFFAPFPAVAANLEAWAAAARGVGEYPVSHEQILANVRTFEAITSSAMTGRVVPVG